MAENTVSFEITANTKPAGKALLELSRLINKAVTVDVKGQEKSIIKQQNEYKKLAKEVNNAFKEIDKLNQADKKNGGKASLPFNQYAANAKKIADLEEQKSNTTDLKERKQLNADISKYKNINNRMDDYAQQVLRQILGTEKAIVSDEQSIFGIKTEQTAKAKKIADDTKQTADNERDLNKTVKETSSGLEKQANATKTAGDAFNKTTKEATSAQAKRIEEARKEVQGLSATIDRILSKNFGGPDKFTFAEFDRAKEDLTELRDLLKLLGIPEEFKADYNRIVEALDKIARGKRMLTKENAEAEKQPVIPTKKIEDEAAAAEQRLYELRERAQKALSQMMDPTDRGYDALERRRQELEGLKKEIKNLGVPKEVANEYLKVSAALATVTNELSKMDKAMRTAEDAEKRQVANQEAIRQAAASVKNMQFTVKEDTSISDLLHNLAMLEEAHKILKSMGFPPEFGAEIAEIEEGIVRLRHGISDYNSEMTATSNSGSKIGDIIRRSISVAKQAFNDLKKVVQTVKRVFDTFLKSVRSFASTIKSAFNNINKSVDKLGPSFNSMAKDMKSNFKHMITNLTKYVFGFRSLFFLVRRLRKYLGEGIQNLVQFDSGDNRLNEWISRLLSSLLYLKNAWAAAFEPVITAVAPILERLIDMVAAAANTIARFIGALTGQTIVFNAVKVSAGDYADSLGGVGDSAGGAADKVKKLTDRLAAFDDLNVLGKDNDDEDTGSGGGGGGGASDLLNYDDMFKIVDTNNKLAELIKKAWENADFTEIGIMVRDKIVAALRKATDFLEDFREIAYKIGKSFITFLNGVFGDPVLWIEAGKTLGATVNVIGEFIRGMLENNTTDYGGNFAEFINSFIAQTDFDLIKINLLKIADFVKTNLISFLTTLRWEDEVVWDWETMESYNRPGIFTMIKKLFGAIREAILSLVGDAEFTNKLGNAVGDILDLIAQEINDAVNKLTPRDFEDFGKSIGSLILTVLSNINEFMNDTSGAFETLVDNIGIMLSALPWEDIFQNTGEIAVKIINAIIKVLNMVGQRMNEVQENGKTLAQNLGEVIGNCIKQIDFETLGNTFGLIAEGIIDGISSALTTADISSIFGSLVLGFQKANPDSFMTVATLAIWGVVAKAIFDAIVAAIPLIFAANSGTIGSAVGTGLNSAVGGISTAVAGLGTKVSSAVAGMGGIGGVVKLAGAFGVLAFALDGVHNAFGLAMGEMDAADFGGINTEVDNLGEGFINAFSSFDQFRLTFAMGIQNLGESAGQALYDITHQAENMSISLSDVGVIGAVAGSALSESMNSAKTSVDETRTAIDETTTSVSTYSTTAEMYIKQYDQTMSTSAQATTDSMSAVRNEFDETTNSVSTYSTTAEMYIKQHDQNLSTSGDTANNWSTTLEQATGEVAQSWSDLGLTVDENGNLYLSTVDTLETETGNVNLSVTTDFDEMATGVDESTTSMSETINTVWEDLGISIPENVTLMTEEVYNKFFELSENIKPIWEDIRLTVSTKMQETRVQATTEASTLNVNLYNLFLKTQQEGTQQFNTLGDNIVAAFTNMASNSKGPMNSFLSSIESMVNHATDALNRLIDNVNQCLSMGSEWLAYMGLPDIGHQSHVPHVTIPRLAEGAVIPPNKEFLAVLGDQSHGTNIEAPLDTIKQAVAEVLATNNSNGEVVELLQELIRVVEDKDLTIGDKEIGKANARYVNKQRLIRGTSF